MYRRRCAQARCVRFLEHHPSSSSRTRRPRRTGDRTDPHAETDASRALPAMTKTSFDAPGRTACTWAWPPWQWIACKIESRLSAAFGWILDCGFSQSLPGDGVSTIRPLAVLRLDTHCMERLGAQRIALVDAEMPLAVKRLDRVKRKVTGIAENRRRCNISLSQPPSAAGAKDRQDKQRCCVCVDLSRPCNRRLCKRPTHWRIVEPAGHLHQSLRNEKTPDVQQTSGVKGSWSVNYLA